MSNEKNIDALEDASTAACAARDKALADLDKVNALIAALVLAEDHACDSSLPLAARRLVLNVDWTMITSLKDIAAQMTRELDRLEDACHDAAHALNSADEADESEAA